MIKTILIDLIIGFVFFEFIEHVVFPLIWFIYSRKGRSISGADGLLGKVVEVKQWNRTEGKVFVKGELWGLLVMFLY